MFKAITIFNKAVLETALFITVRKRSYGKVVFSQACIKNSVQGGSCTPPYQMAIAADGAHPTGMHSC